MTDHDALAGSCDDADKIEPLLSSSQRELDDTADFFRDNERPRDRDLGGDNNARWKKRSRNEIDTALLEFVGGDQGNEQPLCDSENGGSRNERRKKRSRNIPLVLAYTFAFYVGRSLWSDSVLSAFVFLLRNDNPEAVGILTAVMGISQLATSIPAGILADDHRRDSVLRVASIVGIVAVAATTIASFVEHYALLGVSLAVWGVYMGLSNTSISALFADSIMDGDRSKFFTRRMVLVKLGNTAGPTVALINFAILGNNWTVRDCATVMAIGQALSLPPLILLCFLSDDYAVDHTDDVEETVGSQLVERGSSGFADEETTARCCMFVPEKRVIPVSVAASDIMSGLASGMSIRYFPIFFLDNLNLTPVKVQILYMVSPLGMAVLGLLAQRSGRLLGRCQIVVAHKLVGIVLMLAMIFTYKSGLPEPMVATLFVLRTSFMNSTNAISKSVLMDSVPKRERGKWSALESVNMFSWSGSAALGGILVGYKGILFNFYVTAILQFFATLPLVALFGRVKDDLEVQIDAGEDDESQSILFDNRWSRNQHDGFSSWGDDIEDDQCSVEMAQEASHARIVTV